MNKEDLEPLSFKQLSLSILIGLVTFLMVSSSAGPAIVKPLLLDGSLISNGRFAFIYDAYDTIGEDESTTVVGIGSSILLAGMDGTCMQEQSKIDNAKFYNMAMSGGSPYSEMIQIPALVNAKPDVVLIEVGPNSLWGWNGDGWDSLIEYHEFRLQLLSMTMNFEHHGEWYDILEPSHREYIDQTSIEVMDSWSEYTRGAIEEYLSREIDDVSNSLDRESYIYVPPIGTNEWDDYLSTPNYHISRYEGKSPEYIREDLDKRMPTKATQGVYNPKSNGTQNHRALDYMVHELQKASIQVVLVGIPHHPWVNDYLNPKQLDGMNDTYSTYTNLDSVMPLQMYWENWPSDAFDDRNHLDADGRDIFCKRVTPIIDAIIKGEDPSEIVIDSSIYDLAEPAYSESCVGSDKLFIETNGSVLIQAEDYSHCQFGYWEAQGTEWVTENDKNNSQGSGYISALPDSKVKAGDTTNGPRIGYNISFDSPGTYHVWVRMSAPSGSSDSIHVGLNGLPVTFGASGLGIWDPNVGDQWTWKDTIGSRVTIEVPSPGTHQFYIWMREDGVRVDSVFLTQDSNIDPEELSEG